ncbi:MAG: glycosyltransferase family A protein, partial [Alphaproteobacteria bacterium]
MLENCLRSIGAQEVPEGWRYRAIVVENSETAESRDLALRIAEETGLSMDYAIEPERGIPQVRNRSLSLALERRADWIAFIDDDEIADPGWLEAYCRAADAYDAEIMRGPVVLDYPPETPDWLPKRSKAVGETGKPRP